MEEEYFYQYAIAGFRNGKWYREHPNFITLELAQKHIKTDKHKFKRYEKLKIQRRQISKWEDVYNEN